MSYRLWICYIVSTAGAIPINGHVCAKWDFYVKYFPDQIHQQVINPRPKPPYFVEISFMETNHANSRVPAIDRTFLSALHDFSNILACRLPLLQANPDDDTDISDLTPEQKLQLIGPCPVQWAKNISKVLWTECEIQARVRQMANEISKDYMGENIIAVGLLNGAVLFASDLLRHLTVPYELDFMALSSYHGTNSTGTIMLKKDLSIDPENRHVLIIEDLIDTGATLYWLQKHFEHKKAKSIRTACLLDKKVKRVNEVNVDYIGWECPDEFVIGYGMDLNREYRCLPFIGVLNQDLLKASDAQSNH